MRVRPQQKKWRNPAPALAHEQRQQHGEQEQRQQVRPQDPDARRQRQPDRHQRRTRRQRADHQPPGQHGGAHDQRRRAELQARHPGHAIDGVDEGLRQPFVIRPGRPREGVRIGIDARDGVRAPDVLPGPQMPERVVLGAHQHGAEGERHEQQADAHGPKRDAAAKIAKLHAFGRRQYIFGGSRTFLDAEWRALAPAWAALPLLSTVGDVKSLTLSRHKAQAMGIYCEACD